MASPENRNFLIHARNHCIPQREPKQKWLKYQALKVKPSVKPTTVLKKKGICLKYIFICTVYIPKRGDIREFESSDPKLINEDLTV